jgi:hypothetical protein
MKLKATGSGVGIDGEICIVLLNKNHPEMVLEETN